jgi:D-sedoheptulose 7-phosphate isomerase
VNGPAAIGEAAALMRSLAEDGALQDALERVAALTAQAIAAGGTLFTCGNGGSAAEAAHFAAELVGPFHDRQRPAFAAVALGFEVPALTAIANDFAYEAVFARQLQGLGKTGDVLWALSTSGNSRNVIAAIRQARRMSIHTVLFSNHDGGAARRVVDYALLVPSSSTPRVQEAHLVLGHCLCQSIEQRLTAARAPGD